MVRFPLVAREGWGWIAGAAVLALVVHTQAPIYCAVFGWLAVGWLLWAFRDPPREIPITRCAVVSPINGQLTTVERCADPCLPRQAWHLQIKMGWLDVMSIFSPSEAKVMRQARPPPGDPQDQRQPKPHAWIYLQTDDGDDILMVLYATHRFSRFLCYAHIGERVGKGQRCGFCYFACQVDLYLPENSRLSVKAGDRVQAGTSLLAELQRPAATLSTLSGAPA